MRWHMAWMFVLVILLSGNLAHGGKDKKSDKDKVQGSWSGTKDGKSIKMAFKGDQVTVTFDDKETFKGTYKLDATKKPKAIDIAVKEGPKKEYVGKTSLGIYKLEGNSLTWCANEPGRDNRPADFVESTGDAKYLLITLQRSK